ncbi:MAG: dicarboxylate/amino acid:cation symporter [Bacteroidales bacterium]|nr:dicarboxylate/amino acid:cation symporter [Bacteroidales bacterium]
MRNIIRKITLPWQMLIALIFAFIFGALVPDGVKYIEWIGNMFIRSLRMIMIPLVCTSLVTGISNIGSAGNLGRIGMKTLIYYLTTSLLAIITGLVMINIFRPGYEAGLSLEENVDIADLTGNTIGETLISIVPVNIFESLAQGDMLPVIFFSLVFGFFLTRLPESHKTLLGNVFESLFNLMMKITGFILIFAPIGIFGLVAPMVASQENIGVLMQKLGIYAGIVIGGLFIHAGFTLPSLIALFAKIHPLRHFRNVTTPLITAFSTASSNATLPLTMESVKNNSRVSDKISSFTLPLGATLNMDGTALYEIVAAMFIAQAYGIELTVLQQFQMVLTALLASIGAAGIPMAGMVMMAIVLSVVGLPLEAVGLVMAIDPLLDRFRTAVNVWSDTCGSVIIAKSENEILTG